MISKSEDYLKSGKTENQAFTLVVANLVDVDDLLENIVLDDKKSDQATYYLKRNARNIAIGIFLYILGAAVLIGFGGLADYFGLNEAYPIVGLLILLIFAAIATGLIVYTILSTPPAYKNYNNESNNVYRYLNPKEGRILNRLISVYWLVITLVYLTVSFITNSWAYTWIIFILASVLEGIIKTIFEIRYGNE